MSKAGPFFVPHPKCQKCGFGDNLGCSYLLLTGTRRPCPPGEACTCFVPKTRRRRWEYSIPLSRPKEPPRPRPRTGGRSSWQVEALSQSVIACRLYEEGASDGIIAKAAGCSATTVAKWRRLTGRPPNYGPNRKDTRNGNKTS